MPVLIVSVKESISNGVQHFVYASVDRGGPQRSDTNPTNVPHFISKHNIEKHLIQVADASKQKMGWTILRVTAFFDNVTPDFGGKLFAAMWKGMGDDKVQFISTRDIGRFTARVFDRPDQFLGQAVSLAGDELNQAEANAVFEKIVGRAMPSNFVVLGGALKWAVKDLGLMFRWFAEEGYGADIAKLRKEDPELQDSAKWLKESSAFLTLPSPNQQNKDDIARFRHIVRSITASTIGLGASSALSSVLPYHIVPATINAGFLSYYIRELRPLATKAGGKRALVGMIKTHQLVEDVALATVIKTLFLILFLGHDFDVMVDSMAHSSELIFAHIDTGVTPPVENLPHSEVAEWHAALSEHGVFPLTQGLVDAPPEAVQEAMIGTDDAAVWGSEAAHQMGPEGILLVGTVIAGVEQGLRM
ncbi:MAG: hypothetical protein M1832_005378 [Thelocarpon impressellum]|nr:MAG: hypothetical protein M1832_005378 [Thelocarpon impressellum]